MLKWRSSVRLVEPHSAHFTNLARNRSLALNPSRSSGQENTFELVGTHASLAFATINERIVETSLHDPNTAKRDD